MFIKTVSEGLNDEIHILYLIENFYEVEQSKKKVVLWIKKKLNEISREFTETQKKETKKNNNKI